MTCYTLKRGGKSIGFMCGDFGEPCLDCGAVADNSCDYPVGDNKTCNRLLCDDCAEPIGADTHYCRDHYAEWMRFKKSGGVERELRNVVPFKQNGAL